MKHVETIHDFHWVLISAAWLEAHWFMTLADLASAPGGEAGDQAVFTTLPGT